jgi:hypothetical protein
LVNLCCFVNRGCEFEVDTEYESKTKVSIRVDSYKLKTDRDLRSYLKKQSKVPPKCQLKIGVYKEWLKKYLDWFDPELFQLIQIHAERMQVNIFSDGLAGEDDQEYEMAGQK